jgi:long-chain acyl-CoA synthetase
MSFNLATILRESARSQPDNVAIVARERRMSHAELDAMTDCLAANLARIGITAGDTVALQLPNVPQFVIAYFGFPACPR